MGRAVIAAMLGIAVGVTATNAFLPQTPPVDDQGALATMPDPPEPNGIELPVREARFSDRVRVYRFASRASLAELSSRFTETTEAAQSAARELLLGALIEAIAELDPDHALELLRASTLDRKAARTAGLAWLTTVGTDAATIDAITTSLAQLDPDRFRVAAIRQLALASPDAALQLALTIENRQQRGLAIGAVAALMAEQDPYGALTFAESIAEEPGVIFRPARVVFQLEALRHLARASLLSAVDYFNQQGARQGRRAEGRLAQVISEEASRTDPYLALEASKLLDNDMAGPIERSALQRLVRQDPTAALGYVDGLATESRREDLRASIARAYGRSDPEAALAWVGSLDPVPSDLMFQVLEGVARVEPLRALDVALATDTPTDRSWIRYRGGFVGSAGNDRYHVLRSIMGMRGPPGAGPPATVPTEEIGERLLAVPDEAERDRWISEFVRTWSRQEPRAALDWAQTHTDEIDNWVYRTVAENMGERDPVAAIEYGRELPPERQEDWITAVARGVAERDALSAMELIEPFRGDPVFEAGAAAVITSAIESQPTEALTLLATLPPSNQIDVARSLVGSWAWNDPHAARSWVVGLPRGALRDAALRGFVSTAARNYRDEIVRPPEPQMLALFSSDEARQEAIVDVVRRIADLDQAQARALLDRYVSDPAMLSRAELHLRQALN